MLKTKASDRRKQAMEPDALDPVSLPLLLLGRDVRSKERESLSFRIEVFDRRRRRREIILGYLNSEETERCD